MKNCLFSSHTYSIIFLMDEKDHEHIFHCRQEQLWKIMRQFHIYSFPCSQYAYIFPCSCIYFSRGSFFLGIFLSAHYNRQKGFQWQLENFYHHAQYAWWKQLTELSHNEGYSTSGKVGPGVSVFDKYFYSQIVTKLLLEGVIKMTKYLPSSLCISLIICWVEKEHYYAILFVCEKHLLLFYMEILSVHHHSTNSEIVFVACHILCAWKRMDMYLCDMFIYKA